MKQILTFDSFEPLCRVMTPTKALRPLRLMLLHDVEVWNNDKTKKVVTLPEGFISDGASVPNVFHIAFPPFGMYLGAAFVHDYYCDKANAEGNYLWRQYGDDRFKGWAKQCGVSTVRATPMGQAVQSYGKYLKLTGKLK